MMDDPKDIVRDFREIAPDYAPAPDPMMADEDDRVRRVKVIVQNKLEPWERNIILLYADCGSLRKLGKRLDLSHSSVRRVVDEIKSKIMACYYEMVAAEIEHEIKTKK